MRTRNLKRQRLKPFSFQTLYGTAETVPYKDFGVLTQTLEAAAILTYSSA